MSADWTHDGEINEADIEILNSAGVLTADISQKSTETVFEWNKLYSIRRQFKTQLQQIKGLFKNIKTLGVKSGRFLCKVKITY